VSIEEEIGVALMKKSKEKLEEDGTVGIGTLTVGFNEPGSHINSGTSIITLDHITRVDASSDFNGTAQCSKIAITMEFLPFCCQENCFDGLGSK
jgi:hypothetical protein